MNRRVAVASGRIFERRRGRRTGRVPVPGGIAAAAAVALIAFGSGAACAPSFGGGEEETAMEERRPIEEVLREHTPGWMRIPGVAGTGIGRCDDGRPCIRVFLARPTPEAERAIPDSVEGYAVERVVTGEFRPRVP